jgi:predicted methyltransferase
MIARRVQLAGAAHCGMYEVAMGPLLTLETHEAMRRAAAAQERTLPCSLDLQRSTTCVTLEPEAWCLNGARFPYLHSCKERTIYHWDGASFAPVARYTGSLVKLVPTPWGPPTFEIDGIKMLPTAEVSPHADAARKVGLVQPRGKVILDTCGGLGYFAAWCLAGGAVRVLSFENNSDVLWMRTINPWSPPADPRLELTQADISEAIGAIGSGSVDAVLHDPPRFGIAGQLYSQAFYDQVVRVLKRGGLLFHYTGTPNKLSRGRDLPAEVSRRLRDAGFVTATNGDGILARKAGNDSRFRR